MIEHVITTIICVAVIGIVGYYLYRKISFQQEKVEDLEKRYRAIETLFSRPRPSEEMAYILSRNAATAKPPSQTNVEPACVACDIEPIEQDPNELDRLAEEELSELVKTKA